MYEGFKFNIGKCACVAYENVRVLYSTAQLVQKFFVENSANWHVDDLKLSLMRLGNRKISFFIAVKFKLK